VMLAGRRPLPEAVRFANAAAGLACTQHGAQDSLPTRTQVEACLADASVEATVSEWIR
jgi:ribokinase